MNQHKDLLPERLRPVEGLIREWWWIDEGRAIMLDVKRENLVEVARKLYKEIGAFFKTCAGVDERPLWGGYAVYHIFGIDEEGLDVVVYVRIPERDHPWIPSIVREVPAADWCELEFRDLLGIDPRGRLTQRLVLPDDWPEEVKPLRKDVPYGYRPPRAEETKPAEAGMYPSGVPVGPYHPALHEPEYFELYVEGEEVVDVRYRGFHVHRGIEKLAESPRFDYNKVTFLAERICGICGFVHSCAYVMAVERAGKVDVPERAEYVRALLLEVERLHSHLLWLGVAAHLLGYDAGFMHAWRVREKTMVLAEYLTGSRKTYGMNLVGGVRKDITPEKVPKILKVLEEVAKGTKKVADMIVSVPQVRKRLEGTGVLRKSDATALSVVGPVARASGLNRDVRRDYPYLAYKDVSFKVPVYSEGDNLSRTLVRVEEIFESIEIIKQLLDRMPPGEVLNKEWDIEPGRYAVTSVEAPRGEDTHFLITGVGRPYRWRVRAPTYANIPALRPMLRGQELADAPITIASIDPCFSCTDRVLVIDVRTGKRSVLMTRPQVKVVSLG